MQKNDLKTIINEASEIIDSWLNYQTYINELPGLAVGVFIDDEIVFQKEYGYADLELKTKLNDQHLFRIASHSKLFTATAIMKLVFKEKLSLDDKVVKYLPWFISENDENLQHITIRHLLTHSSGITSDGDIAHDTLENLLDISLIKKQVKQGISYFRTSETVKYSNFGYALLGLIIEAVTGHPYENYIQNEILNPLEMKNTYSDLDDSNRNKHAIGYKLKYPGKKREGFMQIPSTIMQPAYGLSSNVEDLIKFFQAHMMGSDILFPDHIKREMQRIQFRMNNENMGLGFGLSQNPEAGIIYHIGGHPGFRTMSGLVKDDKVIVVLLTNESNGPVGELFWGLCFLIHSLNMLKGNLIQSSENTPNLKDIIGFYETNYGPQLFGQINSNLVLLDPSSSNPANSMQILQHKEDYKFIANKGAPHISPRESISFVKNSDGEVIYLDCRNGKHERFDFSY